MLEYNDLIAHKQQEDSCVVCHDLIPTERIIWHRVTSVTPNPIVPICVDCATLFWDVSKNG